jgi:hypothetical protein
MEHHSFNLAFELPMDVKCIGLPAALHVSQEEFKRAFQRCIIWVVALEVVDKDPKALRADRWNRVFLHASRQFLQMRSLTL